MISTTQAVRLLFFVEHFGQFGSGAENYAANLCTALAQRGHEVHVVAGDAGKVTGITTHIGLDRIDTIIADVAPDITVDWGFYHAADIHRMGGGIHSEFMRYSLDAYQGLARVWKQIRNCQLKHRALIEQETAILKRPDARFVANSQFGATQARAAGAAAEAVTVMYNGVDVQRFRPLADEGLRSAQRATWQVDDDAVVLLFVAHNLRLKNLALLCRVLEMRTPQTARLVIVGRKRPAFSSPLLHYAGVSDAMELCYQAADVLVHPSFFDAGANVVLEAMSCGLPVIVSDRCGTDELVNDGGNGYVLPVVGKSIDGQWNDVIGQLIDDPALRGRLGIAARGTAEQHTFSDYVVTFERLLGEVLQQKCNTD